MLTAAPGKAALLALAGALLGCVAPLALARPAHLAPAPMEAVLPAAEVAGRLGRRGYAVSEPMIRRGPTYMATGTDGRGRRLRIVIDGRNAEIIGIRPVDIGRPGDRH